MMKKLASQKGEIWVFLGDSLTEGIGRSRVSYVTELAKPLRAKLRRPVNVVRLRRLDFSKWQHLCHFNFAGQMDFDQSEGDNPLWLLNLAAESTTVESDRHTLDAVACLNISRYIILRGPLETIVRPGASVDGIWPFWVPMSWRQYAGLDPRCFFSSTPFRFGKQFLIDRAKQIVRKKMLSEGGSKPLLDDDEFLSAYEQLLRHILDSKANVHMLALPPVDSLNFPGTDQVIDRRNRLLRELAVRCGADFIEWSQIFNNMSELFCRDGFHPNERGAKSMAEHVVEHFFAS